MFTTHRHTGVPTEGTPVPFQKEKHIPHYYEKNGLSSCDAIFRCDKCGRLVTRQVLLRSGFTPCCDTKKVRQVQTLRLWEWLKIRLGILDFPFRKEFLQEFSRGRA